MVKSVTENPNYVVMIQQGGAESAGGLTIRANAVARLRLQIENRWVNILEALGFDGMIGGIASSILTGAQIVTGVNFLPVWATSHVWRGSSGIELTLEMRFDAWEDAQTDVVDPVAKLIKIFSPKASSIGSIDGSSLAGGGGIAGAAGDILNGFISSSNNFLTPPGPTPYEYFKGEAGKKTITVTLGKVLKITNLIPVNFGWEFENRFVKSGNPICALVTATFVSYTLPTQDDILKFFINSQRLSSPVFKDAIAAP